MSGTDRVWLRPDGMKPGARRVPERTACTAWRTPVTSAAEAVLPHVLLVVPSLPTADTPVPSHPEATP